MPDGTKPLCEPMLTSRIEVKFWGIHLREISQEMPKISNLYIDGLVQDCSNSIANALELLSLALSHWYEVVDDKFMITATYPGDQGVKIDSRYDGQHGDGRWR